MRLILHSEHGFPIENVAPIDFSEEKPPIDKIAEISRLTINKEYRRRQEDGLYGVESYLKHSEGGINPERWGRTKKEKTRIQPYLILGIIQGIVSCEQEAGHYPLVHDNRKETLVRSETL